MRVIDHVGWSAFVDFVSSGCCLSLSGLVGVLLIGFDWLSSGWSRDFGRVGALGMRCVGLVG